MKSFKYICLAVLSVLCFASCEKETEGASNANKLLFELKGEETMQVTLGTSYQEPGFTVQFNGSDDSKNVAVEGSVDAQTVGLYYVNYVHSNKDGVRTVLSRTVIVCDPTVETDISGAYLTAPGTYRKSGTTETPFEGFKVNITKIAPGFFKISDFLGGYYHQRAGYGAAYACNGYVQLKSDNTLVLLSSSILPWNDTLTGISDAFYDPETDAVEWCAEYAGMLFYVVLK